MAIAPFPLSAPSTLADVLDAVQQLVAAAGDGSAILVGKSFEEGGVGSGPRALFVPEPRGKIGAPIEMGSVCSVTHSCDVLVRGVEDGTDTGRYRSAYALADRLLSALRRAASGRLEFGEYSGRGPTDVDAFGAEIAFSFTYARDVKRDAAIWGVTPAAADTSPAQPIMPPGLPASSVTIVPVTTPQGVT